MYDMRNSIYIFIEKFLEWYRLIYIKEIGEGGFVSNIDLTINQYIINKMMEAIKKENQNLKKVTLKRQNGSQNITEK